MIAKTGGNMVLNVDPNNTPDARPIVEACAKAKVYVVTWWTSWPFFTLGTSIPITFLTSSSTG